MSNPRVLLVEDDGMLRHFVRMALEDMDLELLEADCVAVAKSILEEGPSQLILTDLMMPGESGLELLEHLQRHPYLRGSAQVVVLSAGINAEMRQRLEGYDIWRLMLKPVSVTELRGCVRDGLMAASVRTASNALPAIAAQYATPLDTYFGGDRRLFDTYLTSCLAQFPHDIQAGDELLLHGDLTGMRLLAHSLKSVLRILGFSAADLAQTLELDCVAGNAASAAQKWDLLRTHIAAIVH